MKHLENIHKYGNDIIWTLPCLFQNEVPFLAFQSILKSFGFPLLKANIFGSPATKWSGGRRPTIEGELTKEELERLFTFIKKYNGIPTLTFTSHKIEKSDLKSKYENMILDIALEHGCRFIVSSEYLRDYIKSKKDDAYIVSSILKPICHFQGPNKKETPTPENESKFYNKLLKEYDMVVVRPEYSQDVLVEHPEYIDDLSKIEVLINQLCISNCPLAPKHNDLLISCHENYNHTDSSFICHKENFSKIDRFYKNSCHTKYDVDKLVESGVRNLKLQGRGEPFNYHFYAVSFALYMFNTDGVNSVVIDMLPSTIRDLTLKFRRVVDRDRKWPYFVGYAGEDLNDID